MCEEFENERKDNKFFLTFRSGDLNPRFSVIFPPMIWIFMESEEPEIKLKQASKRDKTLFDRVFWFSTLDLWFSFFSYYNFILSKIAVKSRYQSMFLAPRKDFHFFALPCSLLQFILSLLPLHPTLTGHVSTYLLKWFVIFFIFKFRQFLRIYNSIPADGKAK